MESKKRRIFTRKGGSSSCKYRMGHRVMMEKRINSLVTIWNIRVRLVLRRIDGLL